MLSTPPNASFSRRTSTVLEELSCVMMAINGNPTDPHLLNITSVTYGGADFTDYVCSQFDIAREHHPSLTTWTFPVANYFFPYDPNTHVGKCCVVVYRNSFVTPDGSIAWSNFKSQAKLENDSITLQFSGVDDTVWVPPANVPAKGQCVVSAFWFNKDVTTAVQTTFDQAPFVEGQGVPLIVSETTLGPSPNPNQLDQQFCVTYGTWRYPGRWNFQVSVELHAIVPWTLVLPPLFPPVQPPSTSQQLVKFVQFSNQSVGPDVYPQIYSADGALFWDGRAVDYRVSPGTSRFVDLCARAGCLEKQRYTLAWCSLDGGSVWGDHLFTALATSASVPGVSGIVVSFRILDGNTPSVRVDGASENLGYNPADLRLNIFSATWGGTDYTDFVRRLYITHTLASPPIDTSNNWSITADNATFQVDPYPGLPKACVIIYRLAHHTGYTDGLVMDSNDAQQAQATNRYPVLRDISGFRFVSCREGGKITVDLLTQDPQPIAWPLNDYPLVACAVWSTVDVTPYVQSAVDNAWSTGPTDVSVSVSRHTMGQSVPSLAPYGDPWPDNAKQLTVLVGYKATGSVGSYHWWTLVEVHGEDPWDLTIHRAYPPPGTKPTQFPPSFVPDQIPTFQYATFSNSASLPIWAHAAIDGGQTVWEARAKDEHENRIDPGQNRTYDLIGEAGMTEGSWYALSVVSTLALFEPFSRWIKVSSLKPQYAINLTLMTDFNTQSMTNFVMEHDITYKGLDGSPT